MMLEIYFLVWDRHKYVAGLNRLMGSQLSPLDNWIFNDNTINKNLHRFPSTHKDNIIMNDDLNMTSTITRSVDARR